MKDKIYTTVFILIGGLLSVFLSVLLISNLNFVYYGLIEKLDIGNLYLEGTLKTISKSEIIESYNLLINYVVRGDSFKGLGVLKYNELGLSHLEDVRNLFFIIKIASIFFLALFINMIIYDRYTLSLVNFKKIRNHTPYFYIFIFDLLLIVFCLLQTINFDNFFKLFHEVLFKFNYEMVRSENEFINILPSSYFLIMFILILSSIFIIGVIMLIIDIRIIKKERRKMSVKLIAIDLDGTLLNDNKEIMPRTYNALREASKRGIYVVLASGRPIKGMLGLIKELKLDEKENYVINFNGSAVNKTTDLTSIFNCHLTKDEMMEIEKIAREYHMHSHAFIDGDLYSEEEGEYSDVEASINHIKLNYASYDDFASDCIVNKYMLADDPEKLEKFYPSIPQELFDKYTVVYSAKFFLEFLNKNASKGLALKKLCEHLNIDLSECMAIGDEENDLSMLEVAGVKVAMGNANKKLLDIATYVTSSNNDEGVGKAVEKLALNNI